MDQIYLSEQQVSKKYGIAVQTLRNWRSLNRHIPYRKIGRKILYKDQEVMEFLRAIKINVGKWFNADEL
jgi:hypothetical protein